MFSKQDKIQLYGKVLALILVGAGVVLRIKAYLDNRSLFLDEANLARNIAEQSLAGFFAPLDYHQYAPPLFGLIEKGFWTIFGSNELALRLFPLGCGIALLFLLYLLCQKLFSKTLIWWFPIYFLAFSTFFIRYATEAKQYGTDAFTTCLLLLLALNSPVERFSKIQFFSWSLVGILIIWFSMPSVFILAGIGFYYFYNLWKKQNRKHIWQMILVCITWLISFGIYYKSILSTDLSKDYLVEYHATYFIPLLPENAAAWSKLGGILLSLFNTAVGFTAWAYLLSIGLFLLGVFHLFRSNKGYLLLLLSPILLSLLASGLHLYSLIPRLTLFLIPLILLLITFGIHYLWTSVPGKVHPIISLVLLSLIPMQEGYRYFMEPYHIEEIRPVLQYVHENQQQTDWIFMHEDALPAWQFYQNLHDKREELQLEHVVQANAYKTVSEVIPDYKGKRIWLVFSHLLSDFSVEEVNKNKAILENTHQLKTSFSKTGAKCLLYVPKSVE